MALTKQQVAALYIAVYDRAPDTEGLNFWMGADSYAQAAAGFVEHPLFEQTYGSDTSREMVEKFYTNIFGSAGDQEGIDFWTSKLDEGASIADVLAGFLDASINGTYEGAEAIARKATLDNKIEVGLYYESKLGADFDLDGVNPNSLDVVNTAAYKQAHDVIADVTDNPESVKAAEGKVDAIVAEKEEGEGEGGDTDGEGEGGDTDGEGEGEDGGDTDGGVQPEQPGGGGATTPPVVTPPVVTPPVVDPEEPEVIELTLQAAYDMGEELPEEYVLTSLDLNLGEDGITVAEFEEAKQRAETIVAAAQAVEVEGDEEAEGDDIAVAAEGEDVDGEENNVDGEENEGDDEENTEAQINITYVLADTLENLVAAPEGVVEGATEYSLTDEDGFELDADSEEFAAQVALIQGATNSADFLINGQPADDFDPEAPSDTDSLTEALATLSAAQTESANALKTMNEALGKTDAEGKVTPAKYANAEEAEVALTKDVTTAETARDKELDRTVEKQSGALKDGLVKSLGLNNKLTEANLTTARDAVQDEIDDSNTVVFGNNGAVSTADGGTFDLKGKGVDELLDLSGAKLDKDITINLAEMNSSGNKNDNDGGGSDTIVLPALEDIKGKVTIENMNIGSAVGADSVVLAGLEEAEVTATAQLPSDQKGYHPYVDFTVNDKVTFTNLINSKTLILNLAKAELIEVTKDDVVVTGEALADALKHGKNLIEDGATSYKVNVNGETFNLGAAKEGDGDAADAIFTVTESSKKATGGEQFSDFFEAVMGADSGEFFANEILGDNFITADEVSDDLEQAGFTLADFVNAEEALEAAREVEADAGLLEGIVAGINGYMGAGGIDVAIDQNHTLLDLRAEINAALAANADITLEEFLKDSNSELDSDDIKALASGHVSGLVLRALATGNTDKNKYINEETSGYKVVDGVVTVTQAAAPTTGEGTWTKGEAGEEANTFIYTYKPSAAEQALVDSVDALGARAELIEAKNTVESGLGKAATDLIAQLEAIDAQLEKLANAEEAVTDAQDALTEAQPSIDALKAAEAAQADAEQWFEDNGYKLPIELDGTVEATAENDIFLFNPEVESAKVTDFGKQGEDSIFFGEGFTLFEITEGTIADSQGDQNKLEILWQQVGNDVELYVEELAFAGNGSGDADLTKVTLVGVNGSDLQDNLDNGLLSLGEVVA